MFHKRRGVLARILEILRHVVQASVGLVTRREIIPWALKNLSHTLSWRHRL